MSTNNYIIGTDVSFYESDSNGRIQFDKMKSSGAKFTIIRAGQNVWPDKTFSQNWTDAKKAGLWRGSYWFYDSRVSPEIQAKLWNDTLGSDKGELPLFADFEDNYKGAYQGATNFKIFMEEMKRLIPNKEIMIYTGYYYWKENVPASLHSYFEQYSLWIATYNATPMIPLPFKTWTLWQYTENGDGLTYGCKGGAVDLNYFNGTEDDFVKRFNLTKTETTQEIPSIPKSKNTHIGVDAYEINRFGAKCIVHVIDPTKARILVTGGTFQTVSSAVTKYNAQGGMNGGGWPNVQSPTHRTNEIWVSDGKMIQSTAIDGRGFVNVAKDGKVRIDETPKNLTGLWNTWGFDRILGKDGVFNAKISDRYTKDARTGTGITADGKLVILSAEGNDYYQRGLSFPEMWSIFNEFGCTIAGNNDGGSSSAVINKKLSDSSLIIPSDKKEANVLNHVLFFSTAVESGGVPDIEVPEPEVPSDVEEGEIKIMKYKVISSVKTRLTPSMYQVLTKNISSGFEFDSDVRRTVIEKIPLVGGVNTSINWIQLPDGYWIPSEYKGVKYVEERVIELPDIIEDGTDETSFTATIVDDVTGEKWSGILYKQNG